MRVSTDIDGKGVKDIGESIIIYVISHWWGSTAHSMIGFRKEEGIASVITRDRKENTARKYKWIGDLISKRWESS